MKEEKIPLKPIYLYGFIAAVIIAFVATLYASMPFTGFAAGTGSLSAPVDPVATPSAFLPPEPACTSGTNCGEPCWLVAGGQPAGTSETSGGKIGISGCDSMCYGLRQSIDEMLCCSHYDCPDDKPVCNSAGICEEKSVTP